MGLLSVSIASPFASALHYLLSDAFSSWRIFVSIRVSASAGKAAASVVRDLSGILIMVYVPSEHAPRCAGHGSAISNAIKRFVSTSDANSEIQLVG